jgi:gliding motility-associated-like protein
MIAGAICNLPIKNEDAQTKLLKPLYPHKKYQLSIDLAYDPHTVGCISDGTSEFINNPTRLRISGGNIECTNYEVLAISKLITNTNWEKFTFDISPKKDTCTYLKLENWLDTLKNSYLLLDNITFEEIPCTSFNISGDSAVCQGQENVSYYLTPSNCASVYNWNYSGSGVIINGNSDSITIDFAKNATSGNLKVNFYNSLYNEFDSVIIPINVKQLPLGAGSIIGDSIVSYNQNGLSYYITPIYNASDYIWDYTGNGATIIVNANNIKINFSSNATDGTLIVKGSNVCGTGAQSQLNIKVFPFNPDLNIPNSFSPNGDKINDVFVIHNLPENSKLIVFDRLGKMVYESDNYRSNWNGNDSKGKNLPTGTYWYVLSLPGFPTDFKGFVYLKR